MIEREEL